MFTNEHQTKQIISQYMTHFRPTLA